VIFKNIESITENDLNDLIENKVFEKRTLDYKEYFPGNKDSDKKEFLADASSFANCGGGFLIFGISEKKGIPQEIKGFEDTIIDQEKTRLENMIRDGITPRITGLSINTVHLKNSRVVLIMRIPKSWNSPHCVTYNHHEKFYTRNNSGKYRMDVPELRIAFTLSATIIEKIKYFREERISKIYANETPVPFYNNAKLILHLIPLISFTPAQRYNLTSIDAYDKLEPISKANIYSSRYNIDGFITYSRGKEGENYSYVQFYHNGIIEALEGKYLAPMENNGNLLIRATAYEKRIIESINKYLLALKEVNVDLPIMIFITFVGIRDYKIYQEKGLFASEEKYPIDRDVIYLPEIIIERYETNIANALKPSFDALWNASGLPKSPNYNEKGNRIG
jgi:hypothetical protein